jgi:hypothetical protein
MNTPNTQPDQNGLEASNGSRTETAEQTFIRLLSILAQSVEPVSSDETWLLSDLAALAELEASGFISAGDVVRGGDGPGFLHRLHEHHDCRQKIPAELKHAAEAQTSIGFVKTHRFKVYGWFFGIFAAIAAALYVWYLTHQ